jgi:hypothetical protein
MVSLTLLHHPHANLSHCLDADYTIFVWRQQQRSDKAPTLHLQDPSEPLPTPPAYQNPSFYVFLPSRVHESRSTTSSTQTHRRKSRNVAGSGDVKKPDNNMLKLKKEFENFHSTNGVRTVMGSFGPAKQGLLIPPILSAHVDADPRLQCGCC